MEKKNRRQKCIKCKKYFYWQDDGWSTSQDTISCPHCNAKYEVHVDEAVEVTLEYKRK